MFTVILGLLIHLSCAAQHEVHTADSTSVFTIVEAMPEFPGGQNELYKFIGQHTKYPEKAQKAGIEGKVLVQFIVNESGNVSDATVKKSAHPDLDAEALRVVNLFPNFKAGTQQGKAVKVYYVLPFSFKLSNAKPTKSAKKK